MRSQQLGVWAQKRKTQLQFILRRRSIMCKELMSLISLVLLISWGAVASAADLEIPPSETYCFPCGVHDYDEITVRGTLCVPSCATVTNSQESEIDGGTLLVDGGTYISNARFNIGKGDGGYLIIQNGGSFTQQCPGDDCDDGVKLPDDDGGESIIRVSDATFTAYSVELRPERNARIEVCWGATLILTDKCSDDSDNDRYDPQEWKDEGWITPICGRHRGGHNNREGWR
jgi:hypothetical protein